MNNLTLKEKIEFISTQIHEACPELRTIDNGCVVEANYRKDASPQPQTITIGVDVTNIKHHRNGDTTFHWLGDLWVVTRIIGHPISLEHILFVMSEHEIDFENGHFSFWDSYSQIQLGWWQLKRPLTEQSETTINYFYEFISKHDIRPPRYTL